MDEVTPGNVIRPDNRRKHHCIFGSFLQFDEYLCQADAWLPLGVLRSGVARLRIRGGISAALKFLLHSIFTGADPMPPPPQPQTAIYQPQSTSHRAPVTETLP